MISIIGFPMLVVGAFSAPAAASDGTASARAVSPLSPNPGSNNYLTAVSTISATNAWAVGYYDNPTTHATDTLVLHWNGSHWSTVPSPDPSGTQNNLFDVSATSATNAWAVGYYLNNTSNAYDTLILHWNGTAWSQQKGINPGTGFNSLSGVSAISGTDAWAVGDYCVSACGSNVGFNTLILHWNGTHWSRATVADPSKVGNGLSDVSAISATDAWAAGYYINSTTKATETLTEHWNGTAWSKIASPNTNSRYDGFAGVGADSSGNAWAVGIYDNAAGYSDTLTEHWNGTAWSTVASPSPSSTDNYLFDVSPISVSNAWAVGLYFANANVEDTLILHWNGSAWSKVTAANPGSVTNELRGVSAVSATNAWAVGDYCSSSACKTLILHWNGTAWSKM